MTDRERLLEQVREHENIAAMRGRIAGYWMTVPHETGVRAAREAAHHALTAMALRDVIATTDEGNRVVFWNRELWAWERESR